MEIAFYRVGTKPFSVDYKTVVNGLSVALSGQMRYHESGLVLLIGRLKGTVRLSCDRCATEYEALIDEPVELLLSSGIFDDHEAVERLPWPIVEMQDGKIDLDAILKSELAAFESDYHHCPACQSGPYFELDQGE